MNWLKEDTSSALFNCEYIAKEIQLVEVKTLQNIVRLNYTKGWNKDDKEESAVILLEERLAIMHLRNRGSSPDLLIKMLRHFEGKFDFKPWKDGEPLDCTKVEEVKGGITNYCH